MSWGSAARPLWGEAASAYPALGRGTETLLLKGKRVTDFVATFFCHHVCVPKMSSSLERSFMEKFLVREHTLSFVSGGWEGS